MKISNIIKISITIIALLAIFFVKENIVFSNSPDAISIRVIPNPEHSSTLRWYNSQGFTGPAQRLIVDGYEAVRSGRTVYVNAANLVGTQIYTNIYMISYNQEAEDETNDIFSQILNNWKFNTNVLAPGNCRPMSTSKVCIYDSECSSKEYCDSDKAEIIRDVNRMASIAEFKVAFENYKIKNGHYPKLNAGSYLPNVSISVWPSWGDALSKELGVSLPKDPLNILGDCSVPVGYNPDTCWNQETKEFATDVRNYILPPQSFVFLYVTDQNGASFNLCGYSESGFIPSAAGVCVNGSSATGSAGNRPPEMIGANLPMGSTGHPYIGYFQAYDPDDDPITWTLNTAPGPWTGWSSAPILELTGVENSRKLTASDVGVAGTNDFEITLDDGRGGIITEVYTIDVQNNLPVIIAPNAYYIASTSNTIIHEIEIYGDPVNFPLNISLIPPSDVIPDNFVTSVIEMGSKYVFRFSGDLATSYFYPLNFLETVNFTIRVIDANLNVNSSSFSINIDNNRPDAPDLSACPTIVRTGGDYSCFPIFRDPDGHSMTYALTTITPTPSLLTIDTNGEISGPVNTSAGSYTISVRATDEYGFMGPSSSLTLSFQNYCGDGITQIPNMEGTGGLADNGVEQCDDGADGDDTNICYDNCVFTYCGDAIEQTPNGYTVNEQCDDGSNGIDDDLCHDNCLFTYCGDSIRQDPNGNTINEECDDGNASNYDFCLNDCTKTFCGDGYAQKPNFEGYYEDCDIWDGLATSPASSGVGAQYACTTHCDFEPDLLLGGYCGDGIVQGGAPPNGTTGSIDFGETCDPNENLADYVARTGDTYALTHPAYFAAKQMSCHDCYINPACLANPDFGMGCYLDLDNNGVIDSDECQKGVNTCDIVANLICDDVFTMSGMDPKFDLCCTGNSAQLAIESFDLVRIPALAVCGDSYCDWGVGCNFTACANSITCDKVCQDTGQICIGVGLHNPATNSCKYIIHNIGGITCDDGVTNTNCQNAANLVDIDCKGRLFAKASPVCADCADTDGDGLTEGYIMSVGETVCYCQ